MSLILRQVKGSKLTIQEMDNNLTYLRDLKSNYLITLTGEVKSYNIIDLIQENEFQYDNELEHYVYELKYIDNSGNTQPVNVYSGYSLNINGTMNLLPSDEEFESGMFSTSFVSNKNYYNITGATFKLGNGFTLTNDTTGLSVVNALTTKNNKVYVGGIFNTYYDYFRKNNFLVLDSDGSLDTTFSNNIGFSSTGNTQTQITDIKIQSDNKIIVGGLFNSYSGVNNNFLIRLNSGGTIDNTFNNGFNVYDFLTSGLAVKSLLLTDNNIIVGGLFNSYSGDTNYKNIIKLNSNGTINTGFTTEIISGNINVIKEQTDKKLIIGGAFTLNGTGSTTYTNIVRLHSGGTIDYSFNTGVGFNGVVNTIEIQSDNKIIVGGLFTEYSGESYSRIIRLNSNGSVDTSFNLGKLEPFIDIQKVSGVSVLYLNNNLYIGVKNNNVTKKPIYVYTTGGTQVSGITNNMSFEQTGIANLYPEIKTINIFNNNLLVGGKFNKFNNKNVNNFVVLDLSGNTNYQSLEHISNTEMFNNLTTEFRFFVKNNKLYIAYDENPKYVYLDIKINISNGSKSF